MRSAKQGGLNISISTGINLLFILILLSVVRKANAQKIDLERQTRETESLIRKNDLTAALRSAHLIVQQFPASTEGYLIRSSVQEQLGNNAAALTDLGLAIALDAENPESRFARGMLAYRMNRLDLARSDFRYLLKSKTSVTNTVYYRQNNFQGTDRIMTMQSSPADQLLHLLGLVEIKAGNYRRAVEILDSAIQLNIGEADLYAHRGLAHEKNGMDAQASKDFDQAFRLDPTNPVIMNSRARNHKKNVTTEHAEQWATAAIDHHPKSPELYAERALIRLENKDYLHSVQDYDSAIRRDASDPDLWFNRGMALDKAGKTNEAFESFGKAITLDERYAKAWFMQGALQLRKNDFKNAIESFTIAIGIDPVYAIAYQNRAIAYFKAGQLPNACRDITEAEELGIPDASAMKTKMCR